MKLEKLKLIRDGIVVIHIICQCSQELELSILYRPVLYKVVYVIPV